MINLKDFLSLYENKEDYNFCIINRNGGYIYSFERNYNDLDEILFEYKYDIVDGFIVDEDGITIFLQIDD